MFSCSFHVTVVQVEGALAGWFSETERRPERKGTRGSAGGDAGQGVESEDRHLRDPVAGRTVRVCSGS